MNRRGDIQVTILVLLAVMLFTASLFVFYTNERFKERAIQDADFLGDIYFLEDNNIPWHINQAVLSVYNAEKKKAEREGMEFEMSEDKLKIGLAEEIKNYEFGEDLDAALSYLYDECLGSQELLWAEYGLNKGCGDYFNLMEYLEGVDVQVPVWQELKTRIKDGQYLIYIDDTEIILTFDDFVIYKRTNKNGKEFWSALPSGMSYADLNTETAVIYTADLIVRVKI